MSVWLIYGWVFSVAAELISNPLTIGFTEIRFLGKVKSGLARLVIVFFDIVSVGFTVDGFGTVGLVCPYL